MKAVLWCGVALVSATARAQFVAPSGHGLLVANIFENNVPVRDNSSSVPFPPGGSIGSVFKGNGYTASSNGGLASTAWNPYRMAGTLTARSIINGDTGTAQVQAQSESNLTIDFQLNSAQDVRVTATRSIATAFEPYYVNAAFDGTFPFTEGSLSFMRTFHCSAGFHRFVIYARVHAMGQGNVNLDRDVSATFSLAIPPTAVTVFASIFRPFSPPSPPLIYEPK